ncbi:MAG: hypothetical protein ABFD69_04010 [Candidatus Sumerlaeia bacterium]
MSWDLFLFKVAERPDKEMALNDQLYEKMLPFEEPGKVRDAISGVCKGTDWSDDVYGTWQHDGLSMEFNVGDDEPILSLVIYVRGAGDPYPILQALTKELDCYVYDCAIEEVLDWDHLDREGWRAACRQRVAS